MTGVEFHKRIFEKDQALVMALTTSGGGLRGLFDPWCHEYKGTDLPEKLALIKRVTSYIPLEETEQAFIDVMASHGYSRADAVSLYIEGLARLLTAALQIL
jgi:hypothetical protein